MRFKTILFRWFFPFIAIVSAMGFLWIQVLMQVDLTKTEIRTNFVRLVEKESISTSVSDTLYTMLIADYCSLQNDLSHWLFRYTQADAMQSKLTQIEQLFKDQQRLQQSHQRLQWRCKPTAPIPSFSTEPSSK